MTWEPSSVIEEDLGFFQLVVGGVDVTYFRGVPSKVGTFTFAEPFDEAALEISFPQITVFEARPPWLRKFANVDLNLVRMDGTIEPIWEGMIASTENSMDETSWNRGAHCIGCIQQLDLFAALPPVLKLDLTDIGTLISNEFNSRPSMRTAPCNRPICGVRSMTRASTGNTLTSYIHDLLGKSTMSISPARGERIVGIADCPTGSGYWLCGEQGTVIAFGIRTPFFGTMANQPLNRPISGMVSDPQGRGYWLVAEDGGVFAFGEVFAGSAVPIVGSSSRTFVDIEVTPTGDGYWIVDTAGEVYSFGDAAYHGGNPNTSGHPIIGMAATADGGGYWLLADNGAVYSYGNAAYHGNGLGTGLQFMGIESHKQGDGYWLLTSDGHVFGYGDAVSYGAPLPAYNQPPCAIVATGNGNGYHYAAFDGGVFSFGDTAFRGSVPGGGGVPHEWTVVKHPNRVPSIEVKNTWDVHWTVTVGTPGVVHDITEDFTMEPNVIFGEGVDPNGCWWRNTKYPRPGTDIIWPGRVITLGMSGADVQQWKQKMWESGYALGTVDDGAGHRNPSNVYTQVDYQACVDLQRKAGILVDGKVGPQTWVATFHPGEDGDTLFAVHLAPLVEDPMVEQFLYNAYGAVTGPNPDWDQSVVRVERWESFGVNITKAEGLIAAEAEMARNIYGNYLGRVTLKADPEEGSRFKIRTNQNILVKSFEGGDYLFHIAGVSVNPDDLSVELTIDQQNRDLMTVQAVWERDRANPNPIRVPSLDNWTDATVTPVHNVVWDCDAGAGVIPREGIYANLWNVIRIPAGERVDIQQMMIAADNSGAKLAMAVFDRPITDVYLRGVGNPLTDQGYWQNFPQDKGLVVAWGGVDQPGGYWPGLSSNGDPATGLMADQSSWRFESTQAPWMWVALLSDVTTYIQGNIQPFFSDLPAAAPVSTGPGIG